MASIDRITWKTKSGEAREAWRVSYHVAGRRRFKQFPTQRKAKKFTLGLDNVTAKELKEVEAGRGPRIAQLAEEWLKACAEGLGEKAPLEPATVQWYRGHLVNYIVPAIGPLRVGSLDATTIRDFRSSLLCEELARTTAKKVLTTLKTLLGYAVDQGYLAADPSQRVRILLSDRDRPHVEIHSKAEMTAILAAAGRLRSSQNQQVRMTWDRYWPLLLVLVYAGLRLSEARGLERDTVDVVSGVIVVRQRADQRGRIGPPKTHQARRSIHIPDNTAAALDAWLASHSHPIVFPTRSGLPLNGDNIRKRLWLVVQKAAKVRILTLHSARHFFASREIERGTHLKELCQLMGHSDEAFTLRTYGHLFQDAETKLKRRASANERVLSPV